MIYANKTYSTSALVAAAILSTLPAAFAQAPVSPVPMNPFAGGSYRSGSHNYRYGYNSANQTNRMRNSTTNSTTKKPVVEAKSRPGALKVALEQINLTPAQRAQIDGFQVKADEEGQAAYNDRSLTAAQSVAKTNDANARMIANIRSTLTPEQLSKFDALMSAPRPRAARVATTKKVTR